MQLVKFSGVLRLFVISTILISSLYLILDYSPDVDLNHLLNSKNNLFIFLALLLVFFHFALEPSRWYLYLGQPNSSHAQPHAEFLKLFAVMSTVALVSYSLPFKLGLPARLYLVKEFLHLPTSRIIYLLAIDGAINIISWGFAGIFSLFFIFPFQYLLGHYSLILLLATGVGVAVYFGKKPLRKVTKTLFSKEHDLQPKLLFSSALLFSIDILGFGLRHIVLFYFLNLSIPATDAFFIGVLSVFAGIASTLPMGLGAYDATLIFLLSRYGAPIEIASLAPLLNRLLNLSTSFIFGGISSLVLLKKTLAK